MSGHNHYSDCDCGWCTGDDSSHSTSWRDYSSGIAETNCPHCGANVFFYWNEYGSRVYFDCIGLPWDKHPCLHDDTTPPTRSVRNVRVLTKKERVSMKASFRKKPASHSKIQRKAAKLQGKNLEPTISRAERLRMAQAAAIRERKAQESREKFNKEVRNASRKFSSKVNVTINGNFNIVSLK